MQQKHSKRTNRTLKNGDVESNETTAYIAIKTIGVHNIMADQIFSLITQSKMIYNEYGDSMHNSFPSFAKNDNEIRGIQYRSAINVE